MTQGIRETVEQWTGYQPPACPWFALNDPFVVRVIETVGPAEQGNLTWHTPLPSNRIVEGVGFYQRMDAAIYSQQLAIEAEERKRRG